jgi:hypothetical protein
MVARFRRRGGGQVVTLNVPPGTRWISEFVADNPGDWPIHCHKNHHAMNAMSHDAPNMTGVDMKGVEQNVTRLLPGYMNMGRSGMYDMSDMKMPLPPNTLPMMAGEGPFGPIGMGGMFTIIKIRDGIETFDDPGWYAHPPGTVARKGRGTGDRARDDARNDADAHHLHVSDAQRDSRHQARPMSDLQHEPRAGEVTTRRARPAAAPHRHRGCSDCPAGND